MTDQISILPPNATPFERGIEEAIQATAPDLSVIRTLLDPVACPADLLEGLAWAFSIEVWGTYWAEEAQRQAIATSVDVHRRKGTVSSIRQALAAVGYGEVEVIERFGHETYNGAETFDGSFTHSEPDHWAEYRLRLDRPISSEQADQVRAILANVAPVRARLKLLDFTEVAHTYNARISHDGLNTHGVVQ